MVLRIAKSISGFFSFLQIASVVFVLAKTIIQFPTIQRGFEQLLAGTLKAKNDGRRERLRRRSREAVKLGSVPVSKV
jgi:hypothetical protein